VSHVWFEDADQVAWLVVTVTLVFPATAGADQVLADRDTLAALGVLAVTLNGPENR